MYGSIYHASAQVYPISTLSVKEGLPEYTVNKIAQDHYGYLWLGTGRGLARYDGSEVKKFDQSNGFVSAWVTDIEPDQYGRLWISTDGSGLFLYDGNSFINYHTLNGLPSDHIFDILPGEDHLYLATMDSGLICIDKKLKISFINKTTEGERVSVTLKLLRRNNGNLLISGIDGMYELPTGDSRNLKKLYGEGRVYSMFEKKNGNLLFGSAGGLFEMEKDSSNFHRLFESSIQDVLVKEICENGNILWLATNNGLYKINDTIIEHIGKENGLSSNTLKTVFKDNKGKVWTGTDNAGADCIDETAIRHFYFSQQEQPLVTYSLVEDSIGNMLFFTSQYGVASYDGKTCSLYPGMESLPTNILSSFRAADQSIWLTSVTGLISHLSNEKNILNRQVIDAEELYVVHLAPFNNDTIILSTSAGLYLKDANTLEASQIKTLPTIYFRSSFVDYRRTIWALGDGGEVFAYSHGKVTDYSQLINPNRYILTQGYADQKHGLLFFGTSYGLIIWNGESTLLLNTSNGLHGDHVNSLTMDSMQYLWVGHNKGIERLDIEKRKTKFVGYYQGFHPMETNTTVAYTDSEGDIWFGTVESASAVKVNELKQDTTVPDVLIEEIDVNDLHRYQLHIGEPLATSLRLKYNQNNLEIRFKSLNYFSSQEIKYQWKLEGFDKNWKTPSTNSSVNYTNLKPGGYTFLVKAINTDGYESTITSLKIEVRRPFWQTIWFYMIQFSIVGAVILLSFIFSTDPSKSRFANITTLLGILMVFETALFYLSAYTDKYTHGIPVFQIVLNIILAMSLQPLERTIKKFMFRFARKSRRKPEEKK